MNNALLNTGNHLPQRPQKGNFFLAGGVACIYTYIIYSVYSVYIYNVYIYKSTHKYDVYDDMSVLCLVLSDGSTVFDCRFQMSQEPLDPR